MALFSTTITYVEPEVVEAAPIVVHNLFPFSPDKPVVISYPRHVDPAHKQAVKDLVYEKAQEVGANAHQMWITISTCENTRLDPKLQSFVPAEGPNGREDSWGLAQINLPAHPHITREQAQDPEFAITWMANEFAEGNQRKWTCWRNIFAQAVPNASVQ